MTDDEYANDATNTPFEGGEVQLTNWKNPPKLGDLKGDYEGAGITRDAQCSKISGWLDNLHITGKAKIKKRVGRSSHVPKLIRKQAEWRYSALSEPFLSSRDMFKVEPITWEDKASSEQNELILNNQFNTKIRKRQFIDDFVRTGVNEGTIITKSSWVFEEEEYVENEPIYKYFEAPDMVPILEQIGQIKEANPAEYETQVPPELKEAYRVSQESQRPLRAVPTGETQAVTKVRPIKNHPDLEVCDYRRVTIDTTCKGDMDKCRFIVHDFDSSLDELKRDGRYKNLESIKSSQKDILSAPDHAVEDETFEFKDSARKQFTVHEYWGYWDIDGTGIVTPIVAAWVDGTLIRMEENPYPHKQLPFTITQYLPVVRSNYGQPDGHLLEDNQKISGAVTRGMLDIMGRSANAQQGIRKDALDATNLRKFNRGQDYQFNPNVDPNQGIHSHVYPEIPNSAQFMLQLQNMEAESLTGVKAFSGGLSGDALGESVGNGRSVLDAASKREAGILRRMAEGMTDIGRKILAMNSEFLEEEEVVRITNDKFVPIRRDDLAGNFDLHLSISTAEEDNAKAQELAFMLQTGAASQDPGEVRMIRAEIARLRKMPDLAKRIEEYKPEPDPLQVEEQQLKIEKLKAEIAQIGGKTQESFAGAELDSAKARDINSGADLKDLDFVEQESGVKQERELEKQGAQAKGNIELEHVKHGLSMQSEKFSALNNYIKKKSQKN